MSGRCYHTSGSAGGSGEGGGGDCDRGEGKMARGKTGKARGSFTHGCLENLDMRNCSLFRMK